MVAFGECFGFGLLVGGGFSVIAGIFFHDPAVARDGLLMVGIGAGLVLLGRR